MKSLAPLAAVALAVSLACSGSPLDTAQSDADAARGGTGPPQPDESCDLITGTDAFSTGLLALCLDTEDEGTLFLSRNFGPKDRAGLIGKLIRAGIKCTVDGDADGAMGKLTEYANKVISLRVEEKIIEPAGVDLLGDAQALITALVNGDLLCPSGMPPAP
ncbi:MAG: hypothetical protein E4H37_08850 [Gemmatimonadales bacterium]|nr:MAG: hypothetical protein E4H37_08850 [Gemmatimonadales bacterium]